MAGISLPENLAGLRMELSQCSTAATYATSLQVWCWVLTVAFQSIIDLLLCLELRVILCLFKVQRYITWTACCL